MVDAGSTLAQRWTDAYHSVLATGELSERLTLDGTVQSIRRLEEFVRTDVEDPYRLTDPDNEDLTTALVGYLGQTLLDAAGGSWTWVADTGATDSVYPPVTAEGVQESLRSYRWVALDGATGVPAVRGDLALHLPTVSPLHLLAEFLVLDGDPDRPDAPHRVAQRWAAAAEKHRRAHPHWRPAASDEDSQAASMQQWLAAQQRRWPDWAAEHPGTWDFSGESIRTLSDVVRRVTPTVEAFTSPANADFVEPAIWYLGEVFRRTLSDVRWHFVDYRDSGDDIVAAYWLKSPHDGTSPYYIFTGMLTGLTEPIQMHERWRGHAADPEGR